jgi:hypothetical protein
MVKMKQHNTQHLKGQEAEIFHLLHGAGGHWVGLPQILALNIAQFSARIHGLRHRCGLKIENKTEMINGVKYSWYRLVADVPSGNVSGGVQPTMFSVPLGSAAQAVR